MIIINCILWSLILANAILLFFNIRTHKKQIKMCISEKEKLSKEFDNEINKIKENFDNNLKASQSLQDAQRNCNSGEWCRACVFDKECYEYIHSDVMSYNVPHSYHYCTKGICQEFIKKRCNIIQLKIEYIPISELKPYERNNKKHEVIVWNC